MPSLSKKLRYLPHPQKFKSSNQTFPCRPFATVRWVGRPSVDGDFDAGLRAENQTLKRAITSPQLFSGIGNAYSDKILHHARLSPLTWTSRLTNAEVRTLHSSTVTVLTEWTERLRAEAGDGFFIHEHRDDYGVEPLCTHVSIALSTYCEH